MKRLLLMVLVGMVVGQGVASAAEVTMVQKRRCATGTVITSSGALTACSGSAERITGMALTCSGTACAAGAYDSSSTTTNVAATDVASEIAAAANGTTYLDFTSHPIRTVNGLTVLLDTNVRGLVVFTEQANP